MSKEKEINERFVKLSGKFGPIPPGLIDDESDIVVSIGGLRFNCGLAKYEYQNKQDGTYDEIAVIKSL